MALLHFHSPCLLRHRPHHSLLSPQSPSNSPLPASVHFNHEVRVPINTEELLDRTSRTAVRVSLSDNQPQGSVSTSTLDGGGEASSFPMPSASEVVRSFYDGINRHDLPAVEGLIAENCIYEDLIFPRPFAGRKDIMAFFSKFIDSISTDLQFVIDDISGEDTSAVGVTWHFEYKGTPFPFSKGCSFYRLEVLNGTRQIVYARDCVEPAIKPGASTLAIISAMEWLLQRFPQLVKWL